MLDRTAGAFTGPAASPEVFVSYKWYNPDTAGGNAVMMAVTSLVSKLEDEGYHCWRDIGQMGGGDRMNTEIDAGIRGSKVSSYKALNKSLSFSLQGHRLWTLWGHWHLVQLDLYNFQLRMIFQLFPVTVDLLLIGCNLLCNKRILQIYNVPERSYSS